MVPVEASTYMDNSFAVEPLDKIGCKQLVTM
jgi:hypothetical protein